MRLSGRALELLRAALIDNRQHAAISVRRWIGLEDERLRSFGKKTGK